MIIGFLQHRLYIFVFSFFGVVIFLKELLQSKVSFKGYERWFDLLKDMMVFIFNLIQPIFDKFLNFFIPIS